MKAFKKANTLEDNIRDLMRSNDEKDKQLKKIEDE